MYLRFINSENKEIPIYLNPAGVIDYRVHGDFISMNFKPVDIITKDKLKDFTWGLTFAITSIVNYNELTEFLKNVSAGIFIPDTRVNRRPVVVENPKPKKKVKESNQSNLEF